MPKHVTRLLVAAVLFVGAAIAPALAAPAPKFDCSPKPLKCKEVCETLNMDDKEMKSEAKCLNKCTEKQKFCDKQAAAKKKQAAAKDKKH